MSAYTPKRPEVNLKTHPRSNSQIKTPKQPHTRLAYQGSDTRNKERSNSRATREQDEMKNDMQISKKKA